MKAIRIRRFGQADCLRMEDAPEPSPADDEVLIRIKAAGVNPVDTKIRAGKFPRFVPRLPAILGRDICGVVEAAGRKVSGVAAGDSVFGMLDYDRGAYAELTVASTREIARISPHLNPLEAAALPVAALTAWQALFEHGKLRRGQRVLIHAANGGVGHFAVQLAVWRGAEVIATCSATDVDLVRSLGAATVIDYQAQQFEKEVADLDLVLDLIAGETRARSWPTLKPYGILVSTLPEPKPVERTDVSGREVVVYPSGEQLSAIAGLFERGELRVTLNRVFPLTETHSAHLHLEKEHTRGKTVLLVEESAYDSRSL